MALQLAGSFLTLKTYESIRFTIATDADKKRITKFNSIMPTSKCERSFQQYESIKWMTQLYHCPRSIRSVEQRRLLFKVPPLRSPHHHPRVVTLRPNVADERRALSEAYQKLPLDIFAAP